ncbi:V-type ATP synthase subunit F [Lutispora thermophila]|uniref:V/A-type H+-transporting ATPase subunit F n=1 Tax=Lutispora thermophila DSM 19022 TaxID=1122184 RepID=A0A1M6E8I8_9FIRM|nr:V-type ATP synthase subunit F [Lutispora thermophila]SHI81689.1 V/A-type H+-transporting ATPase subunit F [Lutispora thermophila DSM 19022]
MKMFIISDNADALIGFRLAGIEGVVAHDRQKAEKELQKACHNSDIGIILITESLTEELEQEINKIKLNPKMPIVTTIPDRHGFRRSKDYITRTIKESIGLKI